VFGGPAWQWDARRGQYYLHNFLTEQPDLNVHNPAVQAALLDVARFWLDRGVDGFRLDAINYAMHDPALRDNPPAPADGSLRTRSSDFQRPIHNQGHPDILLFLERIRALTDSYGDRFTVAEVGGLDAEPAMKRFTQSEARLHTAYGFTFLYAAALTPALARAALEAWPAERGTGWPSWAFSNHDAPRAISRWALPEQRAAMARVTMLLLVSLRGNVFLYQGEELALPQAALSFGELQDPEAIANWPLTLGRDGARTPMPWQSGKPNAGFSSVQPWLPVGREHAGLTVDQQELDSQSQLHLTRRLLALRHGSEALRLGTLRIVEASESVLAFERLGPIQHLLCVFNLGTVAVPWQAPRPGEWRVIESVGEPRDGMLPAFSGWIGEQSR
jgi:alpha-glucosidase